MKFWIVPSEIYESTWFLFREDGTEIGIKTSHKNTKITTEAQLTKDEINEFRTKYMKTPLKNLQFK